jgi:two-component system, LuxR family, response regulator DctR
MTARAVHLVDDEAPVRDALACLFHSHGPPAVVCDGGAALLTAAAAGPLRGCIVLDVRMEPMSGLQVHDALRSRGMALPVVLLSGHGDITMVIDALHKGAFDFVEKPCSDDALAQGVRRALALEAQSSTTAAVAKNTGPRAWPA